MFYWIIITYWPSEKASKLQVQLNFSHFRVFVCLSVFSGHCWTRPLHCLCWHEVSAPWQVTLNKDRYGCHMIWSNLIEWFTDRLLSVSYRVRLVERGAPQSLPLMESGTVSIDYWLKRLPTEPEVIEVVVWTLFECFPLKILPGVRVIIVNPETRGPLGDSHLGEVRRQKGWLDADIEMFDSAAH